MARERPLASRRDPASGGFPHRLSDNVRFADLDPNQHVNNAVYATYFETGRVTLMKDRSYGLMPDGVTWIMVRLDMHFRAELRWPGTIELGPASSSSAGLPSPSTRWCSPKANASLQRNRCRCCSTKPRASRRR